MERKKNSTNIAEMAIRRLIESLLHLFLLGSSKTDEAKILIEKRKQLDANNPDFTEINEEIGRAHV